MRGRFPQFNVMCSLVAGSEEFGLANAQPKINASLIAANLSF
jgi:hypothetical protein